MLSAAHPSESSFLYELRVYRPVFIYNEQKTLMRRVLLSRLPTPGPVARASLALVRAAGAICWLSIFFVVSDSYATFGDVVARYSFPASAFAMSPTEPVMYATIPSQNSVAIINTKTLEVESNVFVGSGPLNLAFSPDGSQAYIANSTSNFVAVFDTASRTVVNSFSLAEEPQDVVFGTSNRLWVLGQSHIFQIDATTGASTGPSIANSIYSGSLEISPDRKTLYYADYGLSPSTMYKYDVSGSTPVLLLQTAFGSAGSNGQDLALSHSGNYICYATGSGQNNYQIAKFRTSDFAVLGSFNTGPYPRAVTFNPDESVVYAYADSAGIIAFDANMFLSLGPIGGPQVATKLAVDSSGRYLFAGYNAYYGAMETVVYDVRLVQISAIARQTNGDVLLECRGFPRHTNRVEASPDLSPNSFTTIGSVSVDATGAFQFQDSSAGSYSNRFYRVAYP